MDQKKLEESLAPQVLAWFETIHAHPELGLKETRTSDLIVRLAGF